MDKTSESTLMLRPVRDADIPFMYAFEADAQAIFMAAFTPAEPRSPADYAARWARLNADPTVVRRTIVVDGEVAGSIARFVMEDEPEISYWLGRAYWGRGFATHALVLFLAQERERPLFARAAADNHASLHVLQKCGFVICGEETSFAPARGCEILEHILELT